MKIINLTGHQTTPEQIEAGVYDLPAHRHQQLCRLLTHKIPTTPQELQERAKQIVDLVFAIESNEDLDLPMPERALIGDSAPALINALTEELKAAFIMPVVV